MDELVIDGQSVVLNATFSLRWVEQISGSAYPVLYRNGKRVVKNWKLKIDFEMPTDETGGNANTE
jgi:hypothetical protein